MSRAPCPRAHASMPHPSNEPQQSPVKKGHAMHTMQSLSNWNSVGLKHLKQKEEVDGHVTP